MIMKHRIEKSSEGTYYTVPFEVPENVEKITVSYSYDKHTQGITGQSKKANIVDLGLINADGQFVGWSGSARSSVTVALSGGTEGYFAQKIKAGTWQIIVGAYKLCGDFIDVEYNIDFTMKQNRFYFGDLHVHSLASDGKFSAYELGMKAKKLGLDFLALADHNNYSENFSLPKIDGVTFIPAVEWTHYKGHMNLFGVRAPFENSFVANSVDDMRSLISQAKALGATVSVNHPECGVCPYLWGDDDVYDMMEIWNGPMTPRNTRAIEKWTELLKSGRQIPIVGGSDFHGGPMPVVRLGNPVTAAYCDSPDGDSIMNAIRAGHSFVTSGVKGVELMLRCGDAMMGDRVPCDNTAELEIEVKNNRRSKLILVTALGEKEIKPSEGICRVSVSLDDKFAYVKAVSKLFKYEYVTAITNPIYLDGE